MIVEGHFGVTETLNSILNGSVYNHNKASDWVFRQQLEEKIFHGRWTEYVRQIRDEFDKQEREFLQIPTTTPPKQKLQFILWYIEHAEDLAEYISCCEPRRYATDERVRYYVDKVFKRATQLDFQVTSHIIYLQRALIEILITNGPCQVKANKFEIVTNTGKTPISQVKEIVDPTELRLDNIGKQIAEQPAKQAKKKGWNFWRR